MYDFPPCSIPAPAFADLTATVAQVNRRLQHTIYAVAVSTKSKDGVVGSAETTPIRLTLTIDPPDNTRYTITCHGLPAAIRHAWQLCALALWLFSEDAWPLPPWELGD